MSLQQIRTFYGESLPTLLQEHGNFLQCSYYSFLPIILPCAYLCAYISASMYVCMRIGTHRYTHPSIPNSLMQWRSLGTSNSGQTVKIKLSILWPELLVQLILLGTFFLFLLISSFPFFLCLHYHHSYFH